jgi:glycine betaine/proline transport system ATP-binding protein
MSKIRVAGVYKIFGDNPDAALRMLKEGASKAEIQEKTGQVVGVNNANLEVEEGEIFVIMGLSGSGKSTLVRLLNRLIDPTYGAVEVDGEDITKMSDEQLRALRSRKMSMVFQRFALFPHRTVVENAAYGLEVHRLPEAERRKRGSEALKRVGLEGWDNNYPGQLSGGMQQRVGLARALAVDSDIMLMDEAFSALDPLIRREMQDQLLELQSEMKKTIVFITHDLNEAMKLGDHIAVMRDGAIVQIGTAEDILTNPADDYVASFIEDVDRTRVIIASSIMRWPRETVSPNDGPNVALRKMREADLSQCLVMSSDRKVIGVVREDDIARLSRERAASIEEAIDRNIPTTTPDSPIAELYASAAETATPIVVVDEEGRMVGIVPRISLLAALSGEEDSDGS